jgi:hypothetical protein
MRRRLAVLVPVLFVGALLLGAGLSACAGYQQQPSPVPTAVPAAPGAHQGSGTVLESPAHGPQLCRFMATSLPPQCGGIDLVGWDWAAVDNEESRNGTTWGEYQVTGDWDGSALTLTSPPGPPVYDTAPTPDFSTPCPAPAGGWAVIDSSRADDAALNAAVIAANERADFAGLWLDQGVAGRPGADQPGAETPGNDPTALILNVRVTGDPAAAERDLRELWGGALCVSTALRTQAELTAIQNEISADSVAIGITTTSVDDVTGTIAVEVIVDDGTLQSTYDDRYGPGLVRVTSWLQPV